MIVALVNHAPCEIVENLLAMRYELAAQSNVSYDPHWDTAKVFIHVDMASDKGIHFHVQARLNVGILAVRERSDEQIDRDQFTCVYIHIAHGRAGSIDFCTFSRLLLKMVRETVGNSEFRVSFIELGFSHRDLAVPLAAFDILFM